MSKHLHSNDTIVIVACDVEPRTRVYKSGIPTLQNVIGIEQVGPQAVQGITCFEFHTEQN